MSASVTTTPGVILLVGLLAVGVFYIGGTQGWFQGSLVQSYSYLTNSTTINQLNNQQAASSCPMTFTPAVINEGDTITGSIQDGANTVCNVYRFDGSGWVHIYTGTTNAAGTLSATGVIATPGTYTIRAICGSCLTNQVTVTVNDLPPELEPETCNDGDGGKNFDVRGLCTDSTHPVSFFDECNNGVEVKEYFCNVSLMCQYENHICSPPKTCVSGACVAPAADSDGDGFSDADEAAAGTNPNADDSHPQDATDFTCADYCKNIDYAGSHHMPTGSLSLCAADSEQFCEQNQMLPFEASTFNTYNKCCCFDCVGW